MTADHKKYWEYCSHSSKLNARCAHLPLLLSPCSASQSHSLASAWSMELPENLSIIRTNPSLKFPFNLTFHESIFDNSTMRCGRYVVYTAVFCLCFFGNLAVVLVVTCHWRMRSVTKFCMGNLAFANLCVAVFCVYQNLSSFLQEDWILGRFLCKMYHFTNSLRHSASILILVVICGERYLSIVHPLRCRGMLTIQRLRVKRFASPGQKWRDAIVPYEVDSTIPLKFKQILDQVIQDFQAKTCIKFVQPVSNLSIYVRIQLDEAKCSDSQLCRQHGLQNISIGFKCATRQTFAHALGRSLCLIDEDVRPDRDQHLNVSDCNEFPVAIDENDVSKTSLFYDYMSIMHVSQCDGGCVKPGDDYVEECGGAEELSLLDAEKINRLYDCGGCLSYRFVDIRENLSDILIAGRDSNFEHLGICRTFIFGNIVPGKLKQWSDRIVCYTPWDKEYEATKGFEVLTVPKINNLRWIPHNKFNAGSAVLGGRKADGSPIYIARCVVSDATNQTFLVPGRLDKGTMRYPEGGMELRCGNYQVLSCAQNSSQGIKVDVEHDLHGFTFPLETDFKSHSKCNAWSYRTVGNDLSGVLIAAADLDGARLGVCIAKFASKSLIIPGKVRVQSDGVWCYVANGAEYKFNRNFKILTIKDSHQFRWVPHGNFTPNSAVPGGLAEDKTPMYISRCHDSYDSKKLLVPGKLQSGKAWYPFDGREKLCEDYDVLACVEGNPVGYEVEVGDLFGYVKQANTTTAAPLGPSTFSGSSDKLNGTEIAIIVLGALLMLVTACTTAVLIVKFVVAKNRNHSLTDEEVRAFHEGQSTDENLPDPQDPDVDFVDLGFPKSFVIPTNDLSICTSSKPLGGGQFGVVLRGSYKGQEVAIKKVKDTVDIESFRMFLKEIKIMSYIGKHENVVEFYGAVVEHLANRKCLVAVELSPYGDLQGFLKNNSGRDQAGNRRLATLELVDFCAQIAAGMVYLASKKVMHGDLATRNVLVFENFKVKLSDFGLSSRLYCSMNYKRKRQVPLPWRWMAPESLRYLEFSIESDVWSFGITTWEIFSYGQVPYPGITYTEDFASQIDKGVRPCKPSGAPGAIYNIMQVCWNVEKSLRPSFQVLKDLFEGYRREIPTEDHEYYEFLPQPSTSTLQ